MIRVYGIKNCDTVKKACQWLDTQGITYQFHDVRVDGLSREQVDRWLAHLGLDALINRRSTTWKSLDPAIRDTLDEKSAPAVILANPTLIKRPLLETGKVYHTGFNAADYQRLLAS